MQTDVSNVLSDLITLSDNADQIILDSNVGNDQVSQWFSLIKETADAIVKGTYCRASTSTEKSSCFSTEDLPSLVTLVKGKQNSHRVSTLLAEVQKDNRARLSHRKSRKSLRKIILGKGRSNQWKISNRKSSVNDVERIQEEDKNTTPIPKDKLLEGGLDISANKRQLSKSYFSELDTSSKATPQEEFHTPIPNKEKFTSNTDETTPLNHTKLKAATTVVKERRSTRFSSQKISSSVESDSNQHHHEKSSVTIITKSNSSDSKENQDEEFVTPTNKTITIDSDSSSEKTQYETPVTRSKRKSSVQHTQENAKKVKSTTTSLAHSVKQNQSKWEDNSTGNNAFKKIKLSKDINPVPVIPAKNLPQQNQTYPEKRILREIQKKEEKVSQNAKKLRSLQKMKIEENKKAREKKMEKAMQQRMKIEKEKEERIRSRTQSKQENLQQLEPAPKKGVLKKVEPVTAVRSNERSSRSPVKKVRISPIEQKSPKYNKNVVEVNKTYIQEPSPVVNTNNSSNLNATYVRSPDDAENTSRPPTTNEKAPPKPIRNAKKPNEILSNKNTSDFETTKPPVSKPQPSASGSNLTSSGKTQYNVHSSTPVAKKVESKINVAKTPVLNNAKKPNSYAMTPHEASFVSYDISEIKSDDSDEEESSTGHKPIPTWASGVHLRTALLKQHYDPIDIDELFGNYSAPPKLEDIMGMEKKHYHKRTSSAIWLESPNRSRAYYT